MRVKIIASKPEKDQDPIDSYIGQEREARPLEGDTEGRIQVHLEEDEEQLSILQKDEYEIVDEH